MFRFTLPIIAVLALTTQVASAQRGGFRPGLRLGVTDDPDSFFFGGHLAFQGLGGVPNFRIEPMGEIGFGDEGPYDYWTLRFGANLKYMFPVGPRSFFLYPIFGASFYYIDFDDFDSETSGGIHLGFGLEFANFGFDLYVGLPDDEFPDITFAFLYTF